MSFFYFFLLPLEQNQLKLTDIRKDDGMVLILMEYFIDQSRINETMKR